MKSQQVLINSFSGIEAVYSLSNEGSRTERIKLLYEETHPQKNVWYRNTAFLNISSFSMDVFKVKVTKMFKISNDGLLKICRSPRRKAIFEKSW